MEYQGIRDVIKRINGANATVDRNGPWVTTACPFAKWLHTRGTDRSPSFGVIEKRDGSSVFHCFTCKRKGTIAMLWEQLGAFDGNDYSAEATDAERTEVLGPPPPRWRERSSSSNSNGAVRPISDEIKLAFHTAAERRVARRYLKRRGITSDTSELLGLLYDPDDGHGVQRLIFAVHGVDARLYGFTGRAIMDSCDPRVRDYFGLEKRYHLLGAHDCVKTRGSGSKSIVLVEGLFDYAKVRQAGFDCVACLHSGLTPDQVKILAWLRRPVIVALDNDEAGEKGKDQVKKALGLHVPLLKVRYPEGIKDAGDMTSKQIKRMLGDTRLL